MKHYNANPLTLLHIACTSLQAIQGDPTSVRCLDLEFFDHAYDNQSRGPVPSLEEEGSGTASLLELFWWNAINIRAFAYSYACFTLCGDKLTTAHDLHAARSVLVCQVNTVVVHACIQRSCCGHIICIFMFPRISGEKNNSSNDAVPDPSSLVKGLVRETMGSHGRAKLPDATPLCPLLEAYCNATVLVSVCASLLVCYPELRGVCYSGVLLISVIRVSTVQLNHNNHQL